MAILRLVFKFYLALIFVQIKADPNVTHSVIILHICRELSFYIGGLISLLKMFSYVQLFSHGNFLDVL